MRFPRISLLALMAFALLGATSSETSSQSSAGGKASAKRAAPDPIEPVVHEGVRYTVPHFTADAEGMQHNGGYVEAFDLESEERIWLIEVYQIKSAEGLEQDVADVFISSMELDKDLLRLEDETGGKHQIPVVRDREARQEPPPAGLTPEELQAAREGDE